MLSGCFQTEEKALEETKKAVKEALALEPQEVNQKIDQISLHLTEDMEIKGSSANNVYLEKDGVDYLIFYNQYETEQSKNLYEGLKLREDALLLEAFEEDNLFAYVGVFPNGEEIYELQVGVGSVKKISTITELDELEQKAYDLMKLLLTIEVHPDE